METKTQNRKVNLLALLGTVPPVYEIEDPEWFNFKAVEIQFLKPDLKNIFLTVCQFFKISITEAVQPTRKREIVQVRQVSMYFAKAFTKESLATIGYEYGGKDHATVLHANKTINNLIDTDKIFRSKIKSLEKIFTQKFNITAKQAICTN